MRKTLLLFTLSYPYLKAAEDTFLKEELIYLQNKFRNVIIVPKIVGGEKTKIAENILVDETLAEFLNEKELLSYRLLHGLDFKLIICEIINKPYLLFSPHKIAKLLLYISDMVRIKRWLENSDYFKKDFIVFYTYWFTSITSSFAIYENRNKNKVITRVHGVDLYEERNNDYIPLFKQSLENIEAVYCISDAGVNYLKNKYPVYARKYKLSRIGVKSVLNTFNNKKNGENIFRIVSCSSVITLKRVDLIMNGVVSFAINNSSISIEYIHFGDGPLLDELIRIKNSFKQPNVAVSLRGNVKNDEVLNFYKNNYIDVFINASSTEGLPVSLMEAQSFSIPCIGTKVGGIPEIINDNNGILLSKNPMAKEIAVALNKINKMNEDEIMKLRKNSFLSWQTNFNADINFMKFTEEISTL